MTPSPAHVPDHHADVLPVETHDGYDQAVEAGPISPVFGNIRLEDDLGEGAFRGNPEKWDDATYDAMFGTVTTLDEVLTA